MSDVLQGKGAEDRHMPWPSRSTTCGVRGAHMDQCVKRHVLNENLYPWTSKSTDSDHTEPPSLRETVSLTSKTHGGTMRQYLTQ